LRDKRINTTGVLTTFAGSIIFRRITIFFYYKILPSVLLLLTAYFNFLNDLSAPFFNRLLTHGLSQVKAVPVSYLACDVGLEVGCFGLFHYFRLEGKYVCNFTDLPLPVDVTVNCGTLEIIFFFVLQ
jgi:hypothetical protein